MKEIKRTDVRFNLSRNEDRRAWEFLHTTGAKQNRLIIQAINTYADMENRNTWQDTLLREIDHSIREAVWETLGNVVPESPAPTEDAQPEPSQQENDAAMFDFLDSFQV